MQLPARECCTGRDGLHWAGWSRLEVSPVAVLQGCSGLYLADGGSKEGQRAITGAQRCSYL